MKEYLFPAYRPWSLDSFGNRRLIVRALQENLSGFSGTVLEVGCGEKPYRQLLLSAPSRADCYIGMDMPNNLYGSPDIVWDGTAMPLPDASVDSCLLTEVLEHCPDGLLVLSEVFRVLKPDGFLFLTIPFIWPIHTVLHDEYRILAPANSHPGRLFCSANKSHGRAQSRAGHHAGTVGAPPSSYSRAHLATRALTSWMLWPVI